MEIVMTIAGSDPSGGAGIQQDLKTITAHGCYGTTVITALTSQNTLGVVSSVAVDADVVASQLKTVMGDLVPSAVKVGMIPNREVAEVVVEALKDCDAPVVYDPVMISTSGYELMDSEAVDFIAEHLFPLCTLVTPNIPEAERLKTHMKKATTAFLVKGGHGTGSVSVDRLMAPDGTVWEFSTGKIASSNLHGTGCTLSSSIASWLAKGSSLHEAVVKAKEYVTLAIQRSVSHGIGHGNGPLI
jgi:hydroxymethylpyrimidine/phosphomethylpyrimidine kinase